MIGHDWRGSGSDDDGRTYSATHTINCFCPSCNYSVTKSASASSQHEADTKAESAATSAFASHNCKCK